MLHCDYPWTSPSVVWGIPISGNILYICYTLLRLFRGFVSWLGEDLFEFLFTTFRRVWFVEGDFYCRGAVEFIA